MVAVLSIILLSNTADAQLLGSLMSLLGFRRPMPVPVHPHPIHAIPPPPGLYPHPIPLHHPHYAKASENDPLMQNMIPPNSDGFLDHNSSHLPPGLVSMTGQQVMPIDYPPAQSIMPPHVAEPLLEASTDLFKMFVLGMQQIAETGFNVGLALRTPEAQEALGSLIDATADAAVEHSKNRAEESEKLLKPGDLRQIADLAIYKFNHMEPASKEKQGEDGQDKGMFTLLEKGLLAIEKLKDHNIKIAPRVKKKPDEIDPERLKQMKLNELRYKEIDALIDNGGILPYHATAREKLRWDAKHEESLVEEIELKEEPEKEIRKQKRRNREKSKRGSDKRMTGRNHSNPEHKSDESIEYSKDSYEFMNNSYIPLNHYGAKSIESDDVSYEPINSFETGPIYIGSQ